MATFIMNPDSTTLISFTASDGGTASYTYVDDDDTSEYLYATVNGRRIIVGLEAPSVAEADIDMSAGITVTLKFKGQKTLFGFGSIIAQQVGTSADGSSISNGTDTISMPSSWEIKSGTAETTSDGTNAWVYGDLSGLALRINQNGSLRAGQNQIAYMYAEVDYTPAAADNNAIFFGSNF